MMDTSLLLATAAKEAYKRFNKQTPKDIGAWAVHSQTFVASGEDFVLIYTNGADAIVSFRGTSSTDDWAHDIDLFRSKPFEPTRAVRKPATASTVFLGFYSIYKELSEELLAFLEEARPKGGTLYITGHSLGGALAAIFAMDAMCSLDGYKAMHVETFAAPRPGHQSFADAFGQMMAANRNATVSGKRWSAHDATLQHFWDLRDGDVIPLIPQFWFDSGVHVPLDAHHFVREKPALDAHMIANYIAHVKQLSLNAK